QGFAVGGAVGVSGGSNGTIAGATFTGNLAVGGDGADGGPGQDGGDAGGSGGGAVIVAGVSAQNADMVPSYLTVTDSSFLSNKAVGGDGGNGGAGGDGGGGGSGNGGAIEALALGSATIVRGTFVRNEVDSGRG